MDDPWANAWGDPVKPVLPSVSVSPVWSSEAQTHASDHDQEDDIGRPSWSTGAPVQWEEPVDNHSSLWNSSPSKGWEAKSSPYEDIPIGKLSSPDLATSTSTPEPESEPETEVSPPQSLSSRPPSPPVLPPSISFPVDETSTIEITSHEEEVLTASEAPPSPDAFGTFEVGLETDEDAELDPWSPSGATFAPNESDGWNAAWTPPGASDAQETDATDGVDEWEAAKQQKEKQDRYVPPELLISILRQFEEMSQELWAEVDSVESTSKDNVTDSARGRLSGIEDIERLTPAITRLIPTDLSLQPVIPFPKTFTSKTMTDALRLTRHVPFVRNSPMAHYTSSKGSTAWETSVKSRPELASDDFLPPGWRVMEKEKEKEVAIDPMKKPNGGLLSFFGRRVSTPPVSGRERSMSPAPQMSKTSSETPRVSVDSIPKTPTTSSPSQETPTHVASSSTSSVAPAVPAVVLPSTSDASVESIPSNEPTPPPSAVSRFLNRFSRSKTSDSSQRNSLVALSSDDLEFLSDIVPSVADNMDGMQDDAQLRALSNMIQSSPVPTKLPQPLAPPPRPPPQTTRSFQNEGPSSVIKVVPEVSFFDQPFLQPTPPSSAAPAVSLLPSFQPPLAPAPSRPSTSGIPAMQVMQPIAPPLSSVSSRGGTPAEMPSTFRSATPTTNAPIPPPPRRVPTAIMSSIPSSSASHIPKLPSAFTFPPPPSLSRSHTPVPNSLLGDLSLQPAASTSASAVKPQPSLFDDDDDFSDFHSQPAQPDSSSLYDSSFSSLSSDQSLFSGASTASNPANMFDDFDDFVSSPIRTPSPPKPPAKSSLPPPPPKLASLPRPDAPRPTRSSSPPQQTHHHKRKTSQAMEHQRTLSLVETAAARGGRWPAPASPLPPTLAPPNSQKPSHSFDLLDGGENSGSMQDQQAKVLSAMASAASPPAMYDTLAGFYANSPTPPPGSNTNLAPISLELPPRPNSQKPQQTSPLMDLSAFSSLSPSSGSTKSGGLSAQDLSFFEGL